ncbi:MFS domain-containing protein, partial [Trichostrongylus colubriformis]
LWISYITLTEETGKFYCSGNPTECTAAFITNQIFQLVAVITGIGGMYVTDNYGIRLSIVCGTTLNFVGSLVRMVSSVPFIESSTSRQVLLHTGSIIAASAQAFFLVLPSKIAETWFPERQRSLANVLTFIANPFGVVLGTIIPSLYFSGATKIHHSSWHMFEFNTTLTILTTIAFFLSLFIRRGAPPTPPSASSANHSVNAPPFWSAIIICFKNKQFVIQMFTFGLAFAELWGFMVIMSDIITEQGYVLYGYPTALAGLVGVGASLICGAFADCTKKFKELLRVCWVCFTSTIIFTRIVSFFCPLAV